MRNVIVTGGAGYIGSHACKRLLRSGYTPIAVDNLITGWAESVKFGPFVQGDLLDPTFLHETLTQFRPVAVMHFGGLSNVGEASREPEKYWRNNLVGSLNLITAMLKVGCKKLVFSSTCATYGNQDGLMLDEDSLQIPTNAYGASKRAVEEIIHNFATSYDLEAVIFRYFNVAGADPDAEIGEWHQPETHLIPVMIEAATGKRDRLMIFGTDYPTRDGTCIRDYIHVVDLVDAHINGLEWLLQGKGNRVFNLGSGEGFSVWEVIAEFQSATGYDVPYTIGARRAGDVAVLVSGSSRAARELGWHPTRSTLQHMIEDAWRWHQTGGYSR